MKATIAPKNFSLPTGNLLYWSLLIVFFLVPSSPLPVRAQNLQPRNEQQKSNIHGNQLILITHGWDPGLKDKPAWMDSMRDAIAENFLDHEHHYANIEVVRHSSQLVASCNFSQDSPADGKTGTILATLDWSSIANHFLGKVSAQMVAAAVVDLLTESQAGRPPMAELPIHLIGHSRGGGLIYELARLLGERGLVVDQITALDPHPLTARDIQPLSSAVIDTPIAIYENTIFVDCYYQKLEYPEGESIAGAYNRLFPVLPGGYFDNTLVTANHLNFLLLYQSTIDLCNPLTNNEASMGLKERETWFNPYEKNGDHTGFCYSRLKHRCCRASSETPVADGNQIKQGLHPALGGNGERQTLSWENATWPNLASFTIGIASAPSEACSYSIPPGTVIHLNLTALDYHDTYQITVFADQDRNPYNDNNLETIAHIDANPATQNSFRQHSLDWDSATMTNGDQVYLCARITDSEHSRYFYAAAPLLFTTPEYTFNYYIPYFKVGDGYWTGVALTNLDTEHNTPYSIKLYAADGTLLSSKCPEPLPPAGQAALAVTLPGSGWIKLSSRNPVSGLSLLGCDRMINLPFNKKLFTRLTIPHIAQTKTWDTIIFVCNPQPTATDINLVFTSQDGTTSLTHSEAIPSNGSGSYSLATLFQEQASLSGSITITSNQGITVFALYSDQKVGGNYSAGINASGHE